MSGVMSFVRVFAILFFPGQQVLCSQGVARTAQRPGLSYINLVHHLFHHLNISQVGSSLVNDMTDCAIACLRVVTCFSYNVAAHPDIDGRVLCELLGSDKYNFSDKFQANPLFHHFSIHNKCSDGPCMNGGKCSALYSRDDFMCRCPPQFKGKNCETDVDECKENNNNCSGNATCQNTHGSFNCTCKDGFLGDGVQCDDVNECNENKNNCSSNAACQNTVGLFTCKCNSGYHGDGVTCNDTDECSEGKDNCDVNAACQNTEGSFNCACNSGYHGNGIQCSGLSSSESNILIGHSDYETKLTEYLTPVQVSGKRWKLCFRASEHQYKVASFHAACDNKGPTVTLVRVGINVFGGYTDKSWGSSSGYISSNTAFLFSLKNHVNQQYKMLGDVNPQNAIFSRDSYGPTFGGGHDIHIDNDCNSNTDSYSKPGNTYRPPNGYSSGTSQIQSLLAGSRNFKCDEYEVFYQY